MLGPHVAEEESTLFPMLRRHEELAAHVTALEDEHAGLYDDVDDLDEIGESDDLDTTDGTAAATAERKD